MLPFIYEGRESSIVIKNSWMEVEAHSFLKTFFSKLGLSDTVWHILTLGLSDTVLFYILPYKLTFLSLLVGSTSFSKLLNFGLDLSFFHVSVYSHSLICLTWFHGFKHNFSIWLSSENFHHNLSNTEPMICYQNLL